MLYECKKRKCSQGESRRLVGAISMLICHSLKKRPFFKQEPCADDVVRTCHSIFLSLALGTDGNSIDLPFAISSGEEYQMHIRLNQLWG